MPAKTRKGLVGIMSKNFLFAWGSSIVATIASLTLGQLQYIAASVGVVAGVLACISKTIEIVTRWKKFKKISVENEAL